MQHAWKGREIYTVLVGKLERMKPTGRTKRRWENIINVER
jgi:hypothetical protein